MLVTDYIKATVRGTMGIVQDHIQERFTYNNNDYFLWVGRLSVKPLQSEISTPSEQSVLINSNSITVVNLCSENYAQQLLAKGVSENFMESIRNIREIEKPSTEVKNQASTAEQNRILVEYQTRFKELENEINELQNTINSYISFLRESIHTHTNIVFNESSLSQSIANALRFIDGKILALNNQRKNIKQNDLKTNSKSDIPLTDFPAVEIANNVIGMYDLLKTSFASEDNFKSITEVTDGAVSAFLEQKVVTLTREIDTLWIYPRIEGRNMFILVVAKFRNIGETDTPAPSRVTTPITRQQFTITNNRLNIDMIYIQGARFNMGSPASEPDRESDEYQHNVVVNSFHISKHEISFEQYDIFCEATERQKPDDSNGGRGKKPVINVSWHDATAFCEWLSRETGKTYRLPTEAEWEFACRAGTTTPFNTGNCLSTSQANFNGNNPYSGCESGLDRKRTATVGSFNPSEWGLYDIHGNVAEWCSDYYNSDYYHNSTVNNPRGPDDGENRVVRGGSWGNSARFCRCAMRNYQKPDGKKNFIGFRIVSTS
ncbi:MAG: formylglycine-generating enzyme family protein, partial [Bacteroidales bacterium]|nr:formylglycine-generating enzyme family protein [Bacteroidales bacterium]